MNGPPTTNGGYLSLAQTELVFPIDEVQAQKKVVRSLSISNTRSEKVAFKILTTDPKRYFVRPKEGLVIPGDTQQVHILLTTTEDMDRKAWEQCKDKLMIRSAIYSGNVPPNDFKWKDFEPQKDAVAETRLRCRFDSSSSGAGSSSANSALLNSLDMQKNDDVTPPAKQPVLRETVTFESQATASPVKRNLSPVADAASPGNMSNSNINTTLSSTNNMNNSINNSSMNPSNNNLSGGLSMRTRAVSSQLRGVSPDTSLPSAAAHPPPTTGDRGGKKAITTSSFTMSQIIIYVIVAVSFYCLGRFL